MLAGYGIAIPVGAIAVLILEIGMRRGFRPAFAAGTGAAAADLTYATLAVLAGPPIAAAMSAYSLYLRWGSAALLLVIGGRGLWAAWRGAVDPEYGAGSSAADPAPGVGSSAVPAPAASGTLVRGMLPTFLQFLGLTLLNPLTVAYFAALILGRAADNPLSPEGRLAFVAGAWLASWSWQSLLAASGALAQRLLSRRVQRLTAILGNAVVIAVGLRILAGLLA
jgi:arginine exporter protein ArgO